MVRKYPKVGLYTSAVILWQSKNVRPLSWSYNVKKKKQQQQQQQQKQNKTNKQKNKQARKQNKTPSSQPPTPNNNNLLIGLRWEDTSWSNPFRLVPPGMLKSIPEEEEGRSNWAAVYITVNL